MSPRLYESSNPWITFRFAPEVNTLWAKLGEAFSKNQHLAGTPLPPGLATHLASVYLARGALATTAIEGNTLSEAEAKSILSDETKLPPSQEYLETELRNIAEALEEIDESGHSGTRFHVTPDWIREQNRKVLRGLELEEHVEPGQYTSTQLVVGRYRAAPPEDVEFLMDQLCHWLNEVWLKPLDDPETPADMRFYYSFFAATLGHLYLAWIHPFGDGNGRTARLLEVAILAHSGVVPWVSSNLLSDFYNRTRSRYYRRLDAASRAGDVAGFIEYSASGFVDLLREQIGEVRGLQRHVAWTNYVHECFSDETPGKTKERRRDLVLALPGDRLVPKKELKRLTPELAEAYAAGSDKMLTRDLTAIRQLGLIHAEKGAYRARIEIMDAFLPISTGALPLGVRSDQSV